jgi:hypothetical protein
MEGYIKAWNSNDPEDIGRLFAPDSRYYTAPYRDPWQGREGIVSGWLDRKDEPGDFEFRYQVQAISGSKAYVQGWTKYYQPPREYSNLWVVKLNEQGECEEFTEWWMENE